MNIMIENKTVTERVHDALKENILSSKLFPGTRLKEQELSEQLGVSSSPVREALQQLEKEGWIINKPRRGRYVRKVDLREMIEIYEVREQLEGFAARNAVNRITPEQVRFMKNAIDRMCVAVKQTNWEKEENADVDFHRTIFEAAGNTTNTRLFSQLVNRGRMFVALPDILEVETDEFCDRLRKNHMALLEAVSSGDPDRAEKEVRRSIRESIGVYGALLDKEKTGNSLRTNIIN